MKAPDLCLAVYMGYNWAESIPIVKILKRCGFGYMKYGGELTSDELYDMGYFWSREHYLCLDLTTKDVYTVSKDEIKGYIYLVDIEDIKKAISYKRLDGGKGKGPGHFELSKLFAMPKYSKIQSQYNKWCEEWYDAQIRKAKQLEEDRIRKIFEEEERKKREEEARIAEEKRIEHNMRVIRQREEEDRKWKESAAYRKWREEEQRIADSWNDWGKDDYHDGGN